MEQRLHLGIPSSTVRVVCELVCLETADIEAGMEMLAEAPFLGRGNRVVRWPVDISLVLQKAAPGVLANALHRDMKE